MSLFAFNFSIWWQCGFRYMGVSNVYLCLSNVCLVHLACNLKRCILGSQHGHFPYKKSGAKSLGHAYGFCVFRHGNLFFFFLRKNPSKTWLRPDGHDLKSPFKIFTNSKGA